MKLNSFKNLEKKPQKLEALQKKKEKSLEKQESK